MLETLIDLAFPATCLACGKPPKPICEKCIPEFGVRGSASTGFYAAELDDSLKEVIAAVKDRNRTSLVPILAAGLQPCLQRAISELTPDLIVCPPSAKQQFRKRGFNPAHMIFKRANPSGLRVTDKYLKLTRQPENQRLLGSNQRRENVENLFIAGKKAASVLLVDDVQTTGATLASASNAIEKAGGEVVGTCVLAKRFPKPQHL